ncbi:MAG: TlpA disulfide reductase family protein [Desulfobacteraceae bacterium]|jgi:thiol-disulfide isomerase/thioredoxin
MRITLRIRLISLTFLVILLIFSGCSNKEDVRKLAPEFSLEDLFGNTVTLQGSRGSVVLLDFWATWCPPCRIAIPELVELQKKYKEKGLVIIGVSVDDPQSVTNGDLLAFKEEFKINYRIVRADWKVMNDYFGLEDVAIPTMFVIDGEGWIVEKYVGFRPGALEKSLKKLLS